MSTDSRASANHSAHNSSPPSNGSHIIEIQKLQKTYQEGPLAVPVLRGIDFNIDYNEVIALLGPSGSGKSTLLNILGCLDRPTSGAYMLGGRNVSTLSREEQAWVRLHFIGFIFQSFNLIREMTAAENVALPMYYAGVSRGEREHRSRKLLDRVGLGDRLDHLPSQLSGGQRQRVSIARSVACRPKLLLADEPTGALDTRTGKEVLALLEELHAEEGLTIILVTHDLEVAAVARRHIHIRDGKIAQT